MVIHGESILATVKLTEDEYKDISILHYKYIKKGGKKHLFILIFLLFLSGLSVVGSFQNQNIPSSGIESEMIYSKSFPEIISRCIITFIILIAILGIQIYTPYLIKKSAVKEFRSNAVAQKEINYLFSAENIGIESEDFHMKLRYEDIHKVKIILLYLNLISLLGFCLRKALKLTTLYYLPYSYWRTIYLRINMKLIMYSLSVECWRKLFHVRQFPNGKVNKA
ncbi:MAG: hypothetical protein K0S61_4209 [Anaerocolumna sp.]|nr:hypothetical protein [Anaerocolumna sp.]